MTQPTCSSCDCVAGCQSRVRICFNLADPKQTPPTIAAYLARSDDGDMLFFDKTEARRYCEYESEPEPLVLLSAIAKPEQPAVSDAEVETAMDGMHFTATGIPRVTDMRCVLEKFAKSRTIAQPEQATISEFTIADLAVKHLGSYAEKDHDFAVAVISASKVAQPKQPAADSALSNLLFQLDSLAGNGMIPWQIEDAFAEYQSAIAQPKDKP